MKNHYRIVERYKAEKILRFATFLIDYVIIILINYLIGTIIGLLYYATQSEFMYKIILAINNRFFAYLISIVVFLTYYNVLEYFTKGRTIGKFVTGTIAVKEDGSTPTSNDFLKRNFSRIVPFDALSFFGTNGWHDSWSDTRVVKRNAYLEALERENSIEDIGQIAVE
ncbi:RDD family protein [Epilithonimonas sp. JDS]|uniref:RDD family protein n=1 Tax=Epilithonimonas sp. JDS TaxID=2902797 RepID=UPI001E3EAB21|nr:RDD family protein [Epilithonimonas sp. JDS]MCD9853801.1 RDD family protein [Epilithonimonas sp. JDS]